MASFQVTSSELKTKASELRQINAQFKSQLANLDDQEGALIAMWEGEAREAFNSAFKSDRVQMDNFHSLIEQYCVALENIAVKYNQAEAVNTSTASTRKY
jgi:WXG100 family type VII secretion target